MRTRAERRKFDFKKAIRKMKLSKSADCVTYDNVHQYSKNKIHNSCPYKKQPCCTHADLTRLESMNEKEAEYGVDE